MSSHKSNRATEFAMKARATGQVLLVGPIPMGSIPQEWLNQCAVMAIDGGMDVLPPQNIHFSLGDGDSASMSPDELVSPHKDSNDLALGLGHIPREVSTIHLWGFWGGRMDHHLCNFGEIHRFLLNHTAHIHCHAPDDSTMTAYPAGEVQLNLQGTFSLLCLQNTHFQITGQCRYPLNQPTLVAPLSSHTLSNIGDGEVKINADGPFFCFSLKGKP